ncbi:MAG: hypothetical protein ACK47B_21780 [Armatimonadota bacterium]
MAAGVPLTKEAFIQEVHRLEVAGDPEALLAYAEANMPAVEDQLTDEEYEAICGGPLEAAAMLQGIQAHFGKVPREAQQQAA